MTSGPQAMMMPPSGGGGSGFSRQKLFGKFRNKKLPVVVSPGNTLQKDVDVGLGSALPSSVSPELPCGPIPCKR